MSKRTRIIAFVLAFVLLLNSVPVTPVQAKGDRAVGITNPFDKDVTFPLNGVPTQSESYRLPTMVTLADGTIVAAADIRWNTTYDGGGLDTLVARSTDGGRTWNYTVANYLGDNGNVYNGSKSTTFIDPSLLVGPDGMTVYMLVDLYPYGIALNGSGNTQPSTDTGFDAKGNLKLSDNDHYSYNYYLKDGKIYDSSNKVVEGYEIDAYFNITYVKNGTVVKSNLFYYDSPFKVARTQYLYLTKSTDRGATWSEPTLLDVRAKEIVTRKENALLVAPGNAITTSSGVMIFPAYSYTTSGDGQQYVTLIYSTDGVNWTTSTEYTGLNWSSEGAIVELENGTIRVFVRNKEARLSYVDFDPKTMTWIGHKVTDIPTNSNTQLAAITYSKTSNGDQVILVSCPSGPTSVTGTANNDGSMRTNGKIHVFTVNAAGEMTLVKSIKANNYTANSQISGSNYTEEMGFFAYSALTELSDGSIALMYENNQYGWGATGSTGESYDPSKVTTYYTIDSVGFAASELGLKLDSPETVIVDSNGNRVDSVTVSTTEKAELTAKSMLATADVDYQWQIQDQTGKWVNIYGEDKADVTLTFGMVVTMLDDEGDVYIRCASVAGTKYAVSSAIKVHVDISAWENNDSDEPAAPTLSILRDGVNAESVTTNYGNTEFAVTLSAVSTLPGTLTYNWEVQQDVANDIWTTLTTEDSCTIGFKDLSFKYYDASTDYSTVRLTVSNGIQSLVDTFVVYRNANSKLTNSTSGEAVNVTVSGVLPEDAALQLGDASDTTIGGVEEDEIALALDVSITQNGAEWQPAEGETVRVSIPANQLSLVDGQYFTVYHIHDGTTELLGPFVVDNGYVNFEIDGFSVVVITTNYGAAIGSIATFAKPIFVLGNSPENFTGTIVYRSEFPVESVAVKDYYFDASYGKLYYEIDAAPGYTWPEEYADKHWCASDALSGIDVNGYAGVFDENGNAVEEVKISATDPVDVVVETSLQSSQINYQWQICYDVANDLWVDIDNQNAKEISLTAGMVYSLMDENNQVKVRCVTTAGSKSVISDPLIITLQVENPGETEDPTLEIMLDGVSAESMELLEADKAGFASVLSAKTNLLGELTYTWSVLSRPATNIWQNISREANLYPVFDSEAEGDYIGKSGFLHDGAITIRLTVTNGISTLQDTFVIYVKNEAAAAEEVVEIVEAEEVIEPAEIVEAEEVVEVPDVTSVTEDETVGGSASSSSESAQAEDDEEGELVTYNVIINYMNEDGTEIVADPYTSVVSPSTVLRGTVSFPKIPGYVAMVNKGGNWVKQDSYTFDGSLFTGDFTLEVRYFPGAVNVQFNVFVQNAENDEYTIYDSWIEDDDWKTGDLLSAYDFDIDGYYQAKFTSSSTEVAADGSTVVNMYYDRIYYLMTFDLDGGYGTQPIYARHGTRLNITSPNKAGYTFTGWDNVTGGDGDGIQDTMPQTMPIGNTAYKAIWTPATNAKVTIVYWGENPNDEGYSYKESVEIYAKVGDTLNFGANKFVCTLEPHNHDDGPCTITCTTPEHNHSDSCYSDTVICDITTHTHAEEGCTITCSHGPHKLDCYETNNNFRELRETTKPTQTLTNVGNGIYTYRTGSGYNAETHYYLELDGKWYCGYSTYYREYRDTTEITFDCNHIHTNLCWSCKQNEGEHVHSVAQGCFELACTMLEHTHDADCYSCIAHAHTNSCYLTTPSGENYDPALWTLVKSDTVTVAADGSTVMNVYYDRTSFTYTFYRENSNTTYGSITDKWGANIYDRWRTICATAGDINNWTVNRDGSGPWTSYIGVMGTSNMNYYGHNGSGTSTAYYYFEKLDGTYPTNTSDSKNPLAVPAEGTRLSITKEDIVLFEGFTFIRGETTDKTFTSLDDAGGTYNNAKFYYSRNKYTLDFNNGAGVVKTHSVFYEANLGTYDFTPVAPSFYEAGSVEFAGWYQNPECTGEEVKLDQMTMPASNMILYAKWVPVEHDVTIYLYRNADGTYPTDAVIERTFQVSHGKNVASELGNPPANPTNGDYRFVTWAYYDEAKGEEVAIDLKSFQVTKDVVIYAKWSSNVQVSYIIKYVDQATGEEIAPATEGKQYAGESTTFHAKTGTQLAEGCQTGYFPTITSHNISFTEEDAKDGIEYTFYYVKKDSVPYTVYYVTEMPKEGDTLQPVTIDGKTYYIVAETKNKTTTNAVVTETFEKVVGYLPDAYQKSLIISGADGAVNQIIFKYSVNTTQAYYQVTHYTEELNGGYYPYSSYENLGTIGATINEMPMDIPGFKYDHTEYWVGDNKLDGVDPTKGTTLTMDGLDIRLYYTRNEYPYLIEYREQGTNKLIVTREDATADYGTEIKHTAPQYYGDGNVYKLVSAETQSMIIQIEDGSTAVKNVLVFYYEECKVTINYAVVDGIGGMVNPTQETVLISTGVAQGSIAEALAGYKFVGWFDEDGNELRTNPEFVPAKVNGLNVAATYYAKFEEQKVTINYVAVGTGGSVTPESEELFAVTGVATGSVATAKPGYRFVGWFSDADCQHQISTFAQYVPGKVNGLNVAATYYAKFEELNVTIDYVVVGPTGCGTVTVEHETLGAATGTATGSTANASSNVYKFIGWYTKDDAGNYIPVTSENGTLEGNKFIPAKVNGLNVANTYYAMFDYNLTSLTITKAFPEGADYSIDENQTFIFVIFEICADGSYNELKATIHGQGSVTIDGLTVGSQVAIYEDSDWSWRYGTCVPEAASGLKVNHLEDSSITVTLTADHETNEVTFTNTRTDDQWLNGDSWCNNIFK